MNAQGWFVIDFVACVPVQYIECAASYQMQVIRPLLPNNWLLLCLLLLLLQVRDEVRNPRTRAG